ncbi:ATPase [Pseudomonas sp. zbq_18]|uniref:ATPase n=1 Tax=Pseudomonas sp. zbq_18 TaxID=3367251 RepID=UPI00370BE934
MRNDAHDELDHVPSLTTGPRDRDEFQFDQPAPQAPQNSARSYPQVERRRGFGTGPLWALVGALMIALGGLSWWSYQQVSLMEAQLVATQESFARISEEAAGRIQDISGKVVATESNVTSDSEALKLRVKQLETKLAELSKQQQGVAGQQGEQGKRLDQFATQLKGQQSASNEFAKRLDALAGEQKSGLAGVGKLQEQLKGLDGEVAALKKQGDPSSAIARLEQDLLVLRSEFDNRPQPSNNTAEFDAFRAQVTRNINTLTAQMQNLQQQLNARP